jgi:predicted transcriptional regulator
MAFKAVDPGNRVLPALGKPGPVTAMLHAGVQRGDGPTAVLEHIGAAVMPPVSTLPERKRTSSRKWPRQLAAIIACRTEGLSDKEIAQALGVSLPRVRQILAHARKHAQMSDIIDRMEHRAVPTAVDNLIEGLDEKDKDYTLATLKGYGIFRAHSAVKQETSAQVSNELRVVFEMPELPAGATLPQVAIGAIMATPRRIIAPIDANVIEQAAQAEGPRH